VIFFLEGRYIIDSSNW